MKSVQRMNKINRWIREIDTDIVYVCEVELKHSNGMIGYGSKYHFKLNGNLYQIISSDSGRYYGTNVETGRSFSSGFTQQEFIDNAENILEEDYEDRLAMEIKKYFES